MRNGDGVAGEMQQRSNREREYRATTARAATSRSLGEGGERAADQIPSKWVRAKVRITSQIKTSPAEREKISRACGAAVSAGANPARRVRANWEGGHECKK